MMKTLLPTITPDQCDQITGMYVGKNHAAHTVYTTRILYHGIQNVPVGQCPGRHNYTSPVQPADPFTGLDD
jgi:hypothetical protein